MIGGYLYCLHKQGHIDLVRMKVSWIYTGRSGHIFTIFPSVLSYFVVGHDTDCFLCTVIWLLVLCSRIREAILLDSTIFCIWEERVGTIRRNNYHWHRSEYWM